MSCGTHPVPHRDIIGQAAGFTRERLGGAHAEYTM